MEKFAKRLRELREEQNLSTVKLGKRTGISAGAIQRWENGQRLPMADKVVVLARYFKVSTDFLLGLEDY